MTPRERLHTIIQSYTGAAPTHMAENPTLARGLGMDSLQIVEVHMELEDEFEIHIQEDLLSRDYTLNEIVGLIERELALK